MKRTVLLIGECIPIPHFTVYLRNSDLLDIHHDYISKEWVMLICRSAFFIFISELILNCTIKGKSSYNDHYYGSDQLNLRSFGVRVRQVKNQRPRQKGSRFYGSIPNTFSYDAMNYDENRSFVDK